MKRFASFVAIFVTALYSLQAQVVAFMPQWTAQSQFAGYYVALEKGFYAEEGLEVLIEHFGGHAGSTAVEHLVRGDADIITSQLATAIIAGGQGKKLVNVLQTSQKNGLMCVSHHPIAAPSSLDGARVGRWKSGFAEICDLFCHLNGLELDWIPYLQGINLFVSGAVEALLCYSYSEYLQLVLATGGIPEENLIYFRDYGLDFPEDGLYVQESYYMENKETVDKFVRASKKGWDYARANFDETLEITMQYVERFDVVTNRTLQRRMLEEVLHLQLNPATGRADYAPVSREVFGQMCSLFIETGHLGSELKYEEMIR